MTDLEFDAPDRGHIVCKPNKRNEVTGMAAVEIRKVQSGVVLHGIELSDAVDLFDKFDVSERWGSIEVLGASVRQAQARLRSGGHSTKIAQ